MKTLTTLALSLALAIGSVGFAEEATAPATKGACGTGHCSGMKGKGHHGKGTRARHCKKGSMGGPGQRILQNKEALGLTDDQVKKLEALVSENDGKMKVLMEAVKTSQNDLRTASMADSASEASIKAAADKVAKTLADSALYRANMRKSIHSVLTEEQQAKCKALRKEKRANCQKSHNRSGKGEGKRRGACGGDCGNGTSGTTTKTE